MVTREWLKPGRQVGIVFNYDGGRQAIDFGRVVRTDRERVAVATVDGDELVFRTRTLAQPWPQPPAVAVRVVPLTDEVAVAATVRAAVRKVGSTMVALADDLRFPLGQPELEELITALDGLRTEITRQIAELGGQLR